MSEGPTLSLSAVTDANILLSHSIPACISKISLSHHKKLSPLCPILLSYFLKEASLNTNIKFVEPYVLCVVLWCPEASAIPHTR
jgi:hypothetical protein